METLVRVLATFGYTGHFPFAPATFASFVFLCLLWVLPAPSADVWWIATVLVVVLGIPLCTRAERVYGPDGHPIVWDEIAGMMITLFLLPKTLPVYVAGFLLFRVFDIWKPFPAGRAQDLPRGWGVMVDDLVAGLYAHLLLRVGLALV